MDWVLAQSIYYYYVKIAYLLFPNNRQAPANIQKQYQFSKPKASTWIMYCANPSAFNAVCSDLKRSKLKSMVKRPSSGKSVMVQY